MEKANVLALVLFVDGDVESVFEPVRELASQVSIAATSYGQARVMSGATALMERQSAQKTFAFFVYRATIRRGTDSGSSSAISSGVTSWSKAPSTNSFLFLSTLTAEPPGRAAGGGETE